MGPRLKLELIKIEDGVCEGEILYHKYGGTLYYYYWFKNITAINCQISLHYYYFAKLSIVKYLCIIIILQNIYFLESKTESQISELVRKKENAK